MAAATLVSVMCFPALSCSRVRVPACTRSAGSPGRPDRATVSAGRADCCTSEYTDGSTISVASVAAARPPMTARPERRRRLARLPQRERHRDHAGDHGGARHQDRPHPRSRRLDGRSAAASPLPARLLGERDEQDRVRHRHADRHDRAHERLHIQRRPRQPRASPPRPPAPPAPSTRRRTRAAATGSSRPAAGRSPRPPRPARP